MLKNNNKISAIDAMTAAQKIAFAPIAFQAVRTAWKTGLLKAVSEFNDAGATPKQITTKLTIDKYGVKILLDMLENADVVVKCDDNYKLTKIGDYILYDPMTQVNFNFTNDVCYQAAFHLLESIETGKPEGLRVFGDYETIYKALQFLSEQAKKSWFDFDHFYSDRSFDDALEHVFKTSPGKILDIGGNTGKWALKCLRYNADVEIIIADLPGQLNVARKNIEEAGFADRVTYCEIDILDKKSSLYQGVDVVWMSQFLDCFSESEIISILERVKETLLPNGTIFILEHFPDRQVYEAAEYSLNATSLYFTYLANGNSRMYQSDDFYEILKKAGLEIDDIKDRIGFDHTLLSCR
jgi:ubiquinone/menaquinone biosynthesis C-methylase UbiE